MSSVQAHVVCRVGTSDFALRRSDVAAILPMARMDRPAGSPRLLAGFLNVGGQPLAVLHLGLLLGDAPSDVDDLYSHIIRLRPLPGHPPTGLLVDRVLDAATAVDEALAVQPEDSLNGCVAETLKIGDRFVPRLDIERLLLAEETSRLEEMTAAAAARLADWPAA